METVDDKSFKFLINYSIISKLSAKPKFFENVNTPHFQQNALLNADL